MKRNNCLIVSKVFTMVAVFILVTGSLSGWVYYNDTYYGFGGSGEEALPGNEILREYVIEGASYFLESYAGFLLFLERVEVAELAGFEYNELEMILDSAVGKMEEARGVFMQVREEADILPYNPVVIEDLRDFDYDRFQKENRLIEPIFEEVKNYLKKGKIREMYGKAAADIEEILDIARIIKASIAAEEFPTISLIWELDERCSRSLRFGQYTSRIVAEIKNR